MYKAMFLLLCMAQILFFSSHVVAKDWRGITPLRSTRSDVECLLGAPADPTKEHAAVYKLDNEVVLIIYASGQPCGRDASSGWQVPRDTVVEITVSPKSEIRFSDLQIEMSKYQKTTELHRADNIIYTNKDEGESINVFLDKVTYFTYFPAAKDTHLRCPRSKN
ncbi:MAG TPA: hypothetical protein VGV59_05790 [Pyrinomonadaceae bacterium]|nr:hypothetical protein [Pyrinomonadaceae bacterium]